MRNKTSKIHNEQSQQRYDAAHQPQPDKATARPIIQVPAVTTNLVTIPAETVEDETE